jgi:translation initiation factor 1
MTKKNKPDSRGFVYSTDPKFPCEEEQAGAESLAPGQQALRIKLDTKQRAGKAVTLVLGFAGRAGDLEELGKKLKAFCGTGGSAKEGEIIIQGDHRDKLLAWFLKHGYSKTKKI